MAFDKQKFTAYVAELGLTPATQALMIAEAEANEAIGTQFLGQRLRHDDYTRKTQELATTRQQLESTVSEQISGYALQMSEAQQRTDKVLKDFENERISRATADARLQSVKAKYGLSDDDVPTLTTPAAVSAAPTIDIDTKLREFKESLMQDFEAIPRITAIQQDIAYNHQDLTGKRITADEQRELISAAKKDGTTLMVAWEKKYDITNIRQNKAIESRIAEERQKWDADLVSKRDAAVMSTVRRPEEVFTVASSVLGRKYAPHVDPTSDKPVAQTAERLSGAERATAAWTKRAAAGLLYSGPPK